MTVTARTRASRARTVLAAAAALGGGLALAPPAEAQGARTTKVGTLRCDVSAGVGLIITSSRSMICTFRPSRGRPERYVGEIRRFGLDIGATARGVLVWSVLAPTSRLGPGALAGEYGGAGAEATVGAGVGANVLVGGSDRTVSLQPLSVQVQTGANFAAGVSTLALAPAR